MDSIKFAIFDVGQTIYYFSLRPLNDLLYHQTTEQKTFMQKHAAFHYDYKPYMKGLISHQEFVRDLCSFCHVPYSADILLQINKALHLGCSAPFKETLQAMQQLNRHGIEIGILSNALPILSDTKIDIVKPEYAFTSYQLGYLKPDLKIYQEMTRILGCQYNEILFIDDKKQNIEAAKTLGIKGIIYNRDTIINEISFYLPERSDRLSKDATHTDVHLFDKSR